MTTFSSKTTIEPPSRLVLLFLFISGYVLIAVSVVWFVYLSTRWPDPYAKLWGLIPVHFFSGRAGNAGVGLELGFNKWFVLTQCCLLDFIVMLLVFPVFVAGFQRVSKWPIVGPPLSGMHELALHYRDRIGKYGPLGLMAFVAFPLWSTGPLVGVVLGYILGLRVGVTFVSVIIGNVLATAGWIWLFHFLQVFSAALARVVVVAILASAVFGLLYNQAKKLRQYRLRKAIARGTSLTEAEDAGYIEPSVVFAAVAGLDAGPSAFPSLDAAESFVLGQRQVILSSAVSRIRRMTLTERRTSSRVVQVARHARHVGRMLGAMQAHKKLPVLLDRVRRADRVRGGLHRFSRDRSFKNACPAQPHDLSCAHAQSLRSIPR